MKRRLITDLFVWGFALASSNNGDMDALLIAGRQLDEHWAKRGKNQADFNLNTTLRYFRARDSVDRRATLLPFDDDYNDINEPDNDPALICSDNDDEEESVVNVTEQQLRELWEASHKSLASFNLNAALLSFDSDDDEDEATAVKYETRKPAKKSKINRFQKFKRTRTDIEENKDDKSPQSVVCRSVGIDLGTTYSAVSVIEDGKPHIISVDGRRIMPSVVAYLINGTTLIGDSAIEQMQRNPKNTFSSVKRVIGRSVQEIKKSGDKLSVLKVSPKTSDVHSCCLLTCPNLDRLLSPEEVSAAVIKKLVDTAESYLNTRNTNDGVHNSDSNVVDKTLSENAQVTKSIKVTRAVITVPAYFLPNQCAATERAGKIAGLEKVKLLREPEAAALAYGLSKRNQQLVLVFDLGGGTFDVSVLEVGGGFVEVIATNGDPHLGGDDFDASIVNWLIEQFSTDYGFDRANAVWSDPSSVRRLYEAAENAKKQLSSCVSTMIELPLLHGGASLSCELTRKKFESLCKPLLMRLLTPLRHVAIMAGINLPGESGEISIIDDAFLGDEEEEEDDDDDEDMKQEDSNIGQTGSVDDFNMPSAIEMERRQRSGRQDAKARKRSKKSAGKELRRLQKQQLDTQDSSGLLKAFPGGVAINEVVMVGGATRIPAVQRLVKTLTGVSPRQTVNPDEAVSLGAAVMAGIIDDDIQGVQVLSAWQAALYRAFYQEQEQKKIESEAPIRDSDVAVDEYENGLVESMRKRAPAALKEQLHSQSTQTPTIITSADIIADTPGTLATPRIINTIGRLRGLRKR